VKLAVINDIYIDKTEEVNLQNMSVPRKGRGIADI
jgi:hypothetical protein